MLSTIRTNVRMVDKRWLEQRVSRGATLAELASEAGVDRSTVSRWLRRHGLETDRMAVLSLTHAAREQNAEEVIRSCQKHGVITHRIDTRGSYRCIKCSGERVAKRRRRVKEILVEEAGGKCVVCGYSRCTRALSFHHTDPGEKEFGVSFRGLSRSLANARDEAKKCVLLCANCHMEVESGVIALPATVR